MVNDNNKELKMEDLPVQRIEKKGLNRFIAQKSVSQHFLNVAVLQNQISILVETFKKDTYDGMDKAIIIFILLNISFQSLIFCCIAVIDYIKFTHQRAKLLNLIISIVSGLVLIINITITVLVPPTNI